MRQRLSTEQRAALARMPPRDVEIFFQTQRDGIEAAAQGSGVDIKDAQTCYGRVLEKLASLGKLSISSPKAGASRKRIPAPLSPRPGYAPDPEKWVKDKGAIQWYDDGTWEYTDWEGHEVRYINGYPDFVRAGLVRQQVDMVYTRARSSDNLEANRRSLTSVLSDNLWHHHENKRTMQEVDKIINKRFGHPGGRAKHERLIGFLSQYGYKN